MAYSVLGVDMCFFGTKFRKRTRLRFWHWNDLYFTSCVCHLGPFNPVRCFERSTQGASLRAHWAKAHSP